MNDQNESPFGNPRFLAAILIVFVFLWGWQYYVAKKYPTPPANIVKAENSTAATQGVEKTPSTSAASNTTTNPSTISSSNSSVNSSEEKSFAYEDDNVKWSISSFGMGLNYVELKKFTDKEFKPVVYSSSEKLFAALSDNQRIIFDLQKISDVEYVGKAVVNGLPITRTLKFDKEKFYFSSSTEFQTGLSSLAYVIVDKKHKTSGGNFLMPSFEKQDFLYSAQEKIHTENITAIQDDEGLDKSAENITLASINSQYFSQALIDKSQIAPAIKMIVQGSEAILNVNYNLKNSQITKIDQLYFVGPKSPDALKQIDSILPEVMDYGTFAFISRPLLMLMRFMHDLLGNWGLAIIALTLVVRLIMLPFNIMSFKSSRAMQKIQPQLQAIREKYKNDPMQVNRETMALMKQNNANPLSGCLPMLIQIPIFFALWRTIGSSIEIYQQPFFGWITDLSSHDKFFVLPILMSITMYFQQKLTPTTMDPTQQKILNFMPIIFGVFMLSLPSGLTLYNFVSALFGVTQQYFLLKDKSAVKTVK